MQSTPACLGIRWERWGRSYDGENHVGNGQSGGSRPSGANRNCVREIIGPRRNREHDF